MALPTQEGADAYASEVSFGVHHQGGPGIAQGGIALAEAREQPHGPHPQPVRRPQGQGGGLAAG